MNTSDEVLEVVLPVIINFFVAKNPATGEPYFTTVISIPNRFLKVYLMILRMEGLVWHYKYERSLGLRQTYKYDGWMLSDKAKEMFRGLLL